jgi:tRNA-specific 2-thiouridylase
LVNGDNGPDLHRAVDTEKDQSYVLFDLRQSLFKNLLFPIGSYRKEQVRELARQAGLSVYDKPDSVEICFVPDGNHAELIRRRRPEQITTGKIVDSAGSVLADHHGIEQFTIGQRKGLGFAAGERRYVLRIVPEENAVVVGDRDDLLADGLIASKVNWLLDSPPNSQITCSAKIRYRHPAAPATVTPLPDGGARVDFRILQSAVTPGQAVVFYDADRVLGGGWIERPIQGSTRVPEIDHSNFKAALSVHPSSR